MARDIGTAISLCNSMDGRVRLTTKKGVTFDAANLRMVFKPTRAYMFEPIGFAVSFGDHTPELLRVREGNLSNADRAEGPAPTPDIDALRKSLEWPHELPPKTSAAAVRRAEQALRDPTAHPESVVHSAVEAGVSAGIAAIALSADDRGRQVNFGVEIGAGAPLRALLVGYAGDLGPTLPLACSSPGTRSPASTTRSARETGRWSDSSCRPGPARTTPERSHGRWSPSRTSRPCACSSPPEWT